MVRELLKAGANKEAASKVRSEGWWRKCSIRGVNQTQVAFRSRGPSQFIPSRVEIVRSCLGVDGRGWGWWGKGEGRGRRAGGQGWRKGGAGGEGGPGCSGRAGPGTRTGDSPRRGWG